MNEQSAEAASGLIFNEIKINERGRKYKYRSARNLAYAVIVLGSINCIVSFARSIAFLGQWQLLQRMGDHLFQSRQEMMSAAAQSDQVARLLAGTFLATLILTYIAGALWIYRAACNIRAGGARGFENTPGWAVGWYFVPIASLFKPFEAMVEIWNGSLLPERWKTQPTPGLLRWWWGLWLVTNVLGWVVSAIAKAASTLPSLIFETQSRIVDSALDIASTVVFLVIVLRVTRLQTERSTRASELAAAFS
jgi:hypothetical protein